MRSFKNCWIFPNVRLTFFKLIPERKSLFSWLKFLLILNHFSNWLFRFFLLAEMAEIVKFSVFASRLMRSKINKQKKWLQCSQNFVQKFKFIRPFNFPRQWKENFKVSFKLATRQNPLIFCLCFVNFQIVIQSKFWIFSIAKNIIIFGFRKNGAPGIQWSWGRGKAF